MTSYPNPVVASAEVHELLNDLHRRSEEQEATINPGHSKFVSVDTFGDSEDRTPASSRPDFREKMSDKFIALDQDKCQFMYQLMRSTGALNVVEAGTSFGVSTIYLALAVAQNSAATGRPGRVIATEHEESKAAQARKNWANCGRDVEGHIDLRVGDLLETLKSDVADVDLLLLDIWTPLALPTLKLVQPHLKHGAVVLTDNTISGASGYRDLITYLRAENSGFINSTLPFTNGFEMSVYLPGKS